VPDGGSYGLVTSIAITGSVILRVVCSFFFRPGSVALIR
jgi:hypothetical protein